MEPSQEPGFLSQMMMGASSSLPLFMVPHTALPAPSKSKRDWKDDSTALLTDLLEEKLLANSMKSLIDKAAVARNWPNMSHEYGNNLA
jgi:hypothetical protein